MSQPWHFLVYIAADNTLYSDALVSLRQITDASLPGTIRITVQFDGPSAQSACRYTCANGKKRQIWVAPTGYTADRGTRLRDFLNASQSNDSEEERIFLVLWGHGAGLDHVYLYNDPQEVKPQAHSQGANQGGGGSASERSARPDQVSAEADGSQSVPFDLLNSDTSHANRYLKDIQLAEILEDYSRRIGRKIEILGFDACLMGLVEICHEVGSSVSLIVASDEELPLGSWPYDSILGDLTQFPGMDSSTLSTMIVSRFAERYQKQPGISLSAYSLSASEGLATAVRGLVEDISSSLSSNIVKQKILLARDFSRTPEVADYIDLGSFCREIAESFHQDSSVRHRASEILRILAEVPYILYHRETQENGTVKPMGLAIYFPQALPPNTRDLESAVNSNGGLEVYHPLSHSHGSQAWHTYRPQDAGQAMSVGQEGTKTVTSDIRKTLIARPGGSGSSTGTKTPPSDIRKDPGSGRLVYRELIGSEILWDQYVALRFNKETGWAHLIKKFLDHA